MRKQEKRSSAEASATASGFRVLVTGGAGFIGRHLVKTLLGKHAYVRVLDDLSTGSADGLPADAEMCIGDVLDPNAVSEAVADMDLIIHLAAIVGMRLATRESDLAFQVSCEGTKNILDLGGNTPTVLFSSSSVYGTGRGDKPMAEQDTVHYDELLRCDGGNRGYASGKWQVEKLGIDAARSGRSVMIIRPFNVVGPGQTDRYGMVMPSFIKLALRNKPLSIYDDGQQSRAFSHASTFTEALLRLTKNSDSWSPGNNIINIGNPRSTRILDLAKLVLKHTGSRSKLDFIPYETIFPGRRDTRERRPDCTLMESLIGKIAWPDINTVIAQTAMDIKTGFIEDFNVAGSPTPVYISS